MNPIYHRARIAVALLFLVNGALFANMLPRYPEIKATLGLSNAVFGLLVAAYPAGSIIAGPFAGVVMRKVGSAKLAVLANIVTVLSIVVVGFVPSVPVVALALICGGAGDALTDVAQNAQGLRVQRAYGRSILNSFHAVWSIGMVLGGLMAATALALQVKISIHLTISGLVLIVLCLIAWRYCLPEPAATPAPARLVKSQAAETKPHTQRAVRLSLLGLVLISVAAVMVEDAGMSWAALYISQDLGATPAMASAGLIALMGSHFLGRLVGDRLVTAFGDRSVAMFGAALSIIAMGLALLFPTLFGTVIGFACAGFGVATLVPAAMAQADRLPGLQPGSGLTIVSWLMRLGFLCSPPLVGLVADHFGLRIGLLSIPVAGLVVLLCSAVLPSIHAHRGETNP